MLTTMASHDVPISGMIAAGMFVVMGTGFFILQNNDILITNITNIDSLTMMTPNKNVFKYKNLTMHYQYIHINCILKNLHCVSNI